MFVGKRVVALIVSMLLSAAAFASGPALLRVERKGDSDRDLLIKSGVTLVYESGDCFLALGNARALENRLETLGYGSLLLDGDTEGWTYFTLGLRSPDAARALPECGEVLWSEENWVLLRTAGALSDACAESQNWFVRRLSLNPLSLPLPPPPEYDSLQRGEAPEAITPKPLVQQAVNETTSALVLSNWDDIIGGVPPNTYTTRSSTKPGCQVAAQVVFDKFTALGLSPVYQNYQTGYAPNVVGVKTGTTMPAKVYIVIGHLDDAPSSGAAPGADDNASGTVAVTMAAQALACYDFASTIKFIACTGEEQGLYGSDYYANQAAASGEQIQGVLNADMIGWAGDGLPSSGENLDLNYNATSQWLGTLFADCASGYGTGCPVDAFSCPSLTASDHAGFWENGFSAVCGITDNEGYCSHAGDYPYYHTSNDTKANCGSTTFFVNAVKAYIATLAHMADPVGGPAAPPASVTANPNGANTVRLSWPSAGTGLTYEIWRATGGCGYAFAKIGQTTSLTYDDATASGGVTYGYQIRSRKNSYCLSGPTACATGQTTGPCTEQPLFGGLSSVTNPAGSTCQLNLAWTSGTAWCGGPVRYNIYRSTASPFTPGVSNRVVSGYSGTSYSDQAGLASGTRYYYVVRAVDLATGVEETNVISRDGVPTGTVTYASWTDDAGDTGTAKLTPVTPWSAATTGGHTAPKVYYTGSSYASNLCAAVTTPVLSLGPSPTLTFWSKFDIESSWDKGQVEIQEAGTSTWTRVPVNYPGSSSNTGDACGYPSGQNYFTGTNLTWVSYTASLATWANKTVQLRWSLSSDSTQAGQGWWVDDITVANVATYGSCSTLLPPGETDPGTAPGNAQGWTGKETATWHANPQATSYKVYRGTQAQLPALLTGAANACTKYTGSSLSAAVSDDPASVAGGFYWYLVTGLNGAGEGSAGSATAGPRIMNSGGSCP